MSLQKVVVIFTINENEYTAVSEYLTHAGWRPLSGYSAYGISTSFHVSAAECYFSGPGNDKPLSNCMIKLVRVKTSGNLPMAMAVKDHVGSVTRTYQDATVYAVLFGCAAAIPRTDDKAVRLRETVIVNRATWVENGVVETFESKESGLYDVTSLKTDKMGILRADANAVFARYLSQATGFNRREALCTDKVIEIKECDRESIEDQFPNRDRPTYRQLIRSTGASLIDMESFGFLAAVPPFTRNCVIRVATDEMADHQKGADNAQIDILIDRVEESLYSTLHAIAEDDGLFDMNRFELQLHDALNHVADRVLEACSISQPSGRWLFDQCRYILNFVSYDSLSDSTSISASAKALLEDLATTVKRGYSTSSMKEHSKQYSHVIQSGNNQSNSQPNGLELFCEYLDPLANTGELSYSYQLALAIARLVQDTHDEWFQIGIANEHIENTNTHDCICYVFADDFRNKLFDEAVLVVGTAPNQRETEPFEKYRYVQWCGFEDDDNLQSGLEWLYNESEPKLRMTSGHATDIGTIATSLAHISEEHMKEHN